MSYLFSKGIKAPSGFRYFRRSEDLLKPVWEVSGYSEEQYGAPANRWVSTMQAKLANRKEGINEALRRQMADACELASTRVDLVNEGAKKLKEIGDRCLTAAEYDDLSTPSRDGQTKAAFADLTETYKKANSGRAAIEPSLATELKSIFGTKEDGQSTFCPLAYRPGKSMSLGELRRRLSAGKFSSNPNDPASVRWGDVQGPSERAAACPVY